MESSENTKKKKESNQLFRWARKKRQELKFSSVDCEYKRLIVNRDIFYFRSKTHPSGWKTSISLPKVFVSEKQTEISMLVHKSSSIFFASSEFWSTSLIPIFPCHSICSGDTLLPDTVSPRGAPGAHSPPLVSCSSSLVGGTSWPLWALRIAFRRKVKEVRLQWLSEFRCLHPCRCTSHCLSNGLTLIGSE